MTSNILDALAKPPPPPSELDELMSRDPLEMTKDNIDSIIAYQRNARAAREGAPKGRGKRSDLTDMTDKPIDLAALGLLKPATKPASPTIKPIMGGASFRRL